MFTLPFKVVLAILSHFIFLLRKTWQNTKEKCADECSSWKLDVWLVPSQARLTLGFLISLLKFKFIWCPWIVSGLVPLLVKSKVSSSCLVWCTPKAKSWWLCWWKVLLGFPSICISGLPKAHDFGLPHLNLQCRVAVYSRGGSQHGVVRTQSCGISLPGCSAMLPSLII